MQFNFQFKVAGLVRLFQSLQSTTYRLIGKSRIINGVRNKFDGPDREAIRERELVERWLVATRVVFSSAEYDKVNGTGTRTKGTRSDFFEVTSTGGWHIAERFWRGGQYDEWVHAEGNPRKWDSCVFPVVRRLARLERIEGSSLIRAALVYRGFSFGITLFEPKHTRWFIQLTRFIRKSCGIELQHGAELSRPRVGRANAAKEKRKRLETRRRREKSPERRQGTPQDLSIGRGLSIGELSASHSVL